MKSFSFYTKLSTVVLVSVILLVACQDDDPSNILPDLESEPTRSYDGTFLQDYFFLNCRITQTTPGFLPTQSSRAYGYVGLAAYESVVHGIGSEYSLAGQINGLEPGDLLTPDAGMEYNWAIACNAATAHMMRRMYEINIIEENSQRIDQMEYENRVALSQNVAQDVIKRSENYGLAIAEAIYQFSKDDGGHQSYLAPFDQNGFQMAKEPYCWVPTGAQLAPLNPYWGENRSFVPGVVEMSQPIPNIPFSKDKNSEFYGQAMDVYNQVTNNTAEEETIAKYWADDPFVTCTPTGHTFNIITQLLQESDATLEKTAVGLAMMAVAENDAFISCWKSKFDYLLIRPVSFIQQNIDPDFTTVIGTPPFPAYISGHSAEMGAGAKVMVHLFSDESGDYTFTDLSQIQFGFEARTYDNFYEMAEECALSRYYGGIHYEMDNVEGLDLGFAVGDAVVNDLNWPQEIQ